MLNLFLPYPPSVNTYWGFKGSQRFLTAKARQFKKEVFAAFVLSEHKGFEDQRVSLTVYLHAPDKRVRDIDNIAKPLLDALTEAGVFVDIGELVWDAVSQYCEATATDRAESIIQLRKKS